MPRAPAPIALFVYNRPVHARRTVETLLRNELAAQSDLVVFADGAKNPAQEAGVRAVREYIRTIEGFRSVGIREREHNAGLARSIIEGVTAMVTEHGRTIVLEDDLVTSRWFLRFMNDGLDLYEDEARVASIHGYRYPGPAIAMPTFFLRGADCWGWATWQRAWRNFESDGTQLLARLAAERLEERFDLDGAYSFTGMLRDQVAGLNNSWAVRWHASCFLRDELTLYPGRSLVENIGHDSSGTHCSDTEMFAAAVSTERVSVERIALVESEEARRAFARFLSGAGDGSLRRALRFIRRAVLRR